jgi:hypothetical protein
LFIDSNSQTWLVNTALAHTAAVGAHCYRRQQKYRLMLRA